MVTSITIKESGDAGATWAITTDGGSETLLAGFADWSQLPPSRIKSFLTRQFASIAALADAFASESIATSIYSFDGMGAVCWSIDGSGYAVASTYNTSNRRAIDLQIRLPHSVSI